MTDAQEPPMPPGQPRRRPMLRSLLLDLAHHAMQEPGTRLCLAPGHLPVLLLPGGGIYPHPDYDALTVADTLGLFAALAGPANPGDGPYGFGVDASEVHYALRATTHRFVCRARRAGESHSDGFAIDVDLVSSGSGATGR